MTTLALEFSSDQHSVAVRRPTPSGGRLVWQRIESGGRATRAIGMIEAVLREAELGRADLERMVIGLGPGSYTGIRAALAVAQGWELVCGIPLLGISSAAAVAREAWELGMRGRVAVVIDAQRGEFYLAQCQLEEAGARPGISLRLAGRGEIERLAAEGWRLAGPGADQHFPGGRPVFPRAGGLAELAAGRADSTPGDQLEPIYLRTPGFVKTPPSRLSGI